MYSTNNWGHHWIKELRKCDPSVALNKCFSTHLKVGKIKIKNTTEKLYLLPNVFSISCESVRTKMHAHICTANKGNDKLPINRKTNDFWKWIQQQRIQYARPYFLFAVEEEEGNDKNNGKKHQCACIFIFSGAPVMRWQWMGCVWAMRRYVDCFRWKWAETVILTKRQRVDVATARQQCKQSQSKRKKKVSSRQIVWFTFFSSLLVNQKSS